MGDIVAPHAHTCGGQNQPTVFRILREPAQAVEVMVDRPGCRKRLGAIDANGFSGGLPIEYQLFERTNSPGECLQGQPATIMVLILSQAF